MKKLIYVIFFMMLMSMIYGISQPDNTDPFVLGTITGPPPEPGTGSEGMCEPWEVANRECIGDTAHYDLCIRTVDGGMWQARSDLCNADFPDNVCKMGKCMKPDQASQVDMKMWLIIGGIVLILAFFFGRRKK